MKVPDLLLKHGGWIAFLGGWGAIATARYTGFSWSKIFFGERSLPLWAWIVAFAAGAVLARLDIKVTRWILQASGHLKKEGIDGAAEVNRGDSWTSILVEVAKWGGISFGEEGVRVGIVALLLSLLPMKLRFLEVAIIAGGLLGLIHLLYLNVLIVPTKLIFHLLLSLIFAQWGIMTSFIVHFAFNLSMVFDIEISSE